MTDYELGVELLKVLSNNVVDQTKAKKLILEGADLSLIHNKTTLHNQGSTALIYASKKGLRELVDLMIQNGANVNKKNQKTNLSPLQYALTYARSSVAELLIKSGADVNVTDVQGNTLLSTAILSYNTYIAKLLIEHGADVNAPSGTNKTPVLDTAISHLDKERVEFLLKNGADVTKGDPVSKAILTQQVDILKLLLADPRLIVTQKMVYEAISRQKFITIDTPTWDEKRIKSDLIVRLLKERLETQNKEGKENPIPVIENNGKEKATANVSKEKQAKKSTLKTKGKTDTTVSTQNADLIKKYETAVMRLHHFTKREKIEEYALKIQNLLEQGMDIDHPIKDLDNSTLLHVLCLKIDEIKFAKNGVACDLTVPTLLRKYNPNPFIENTEGYTPMMFLTLMVEASNRYGNVIKQAKKLNLHLLSSYERSWQTKKLGQVLEPLAVLATLYQEKNNKSIKEIVNKAGDNLLKLAFILQGKHPHQKED